MPIAPRAPPTAMQGKCERGHSFSTPGLQFHGVDRADVYYNICVRASRCGKCALNPLTSHPIPRRRPTPVPAQRHARPEHFRSPTQRRCTPAGCAMHSPPTSQHIPRRRSAPTPHSDAPFPSIFSLPSRALPLPRPATMHARRPHNPFPVEDLLPPPHSDTPSPSTSAPPRSTDPRPPTARHIPRRRPSPAPAQRHALPLHSASGTKKRHRTVHVRCRMSRSTVVAVGHLGW